MTDLLGVVTRTGSSGTVVLRQTYRTDVDDLWEALTTPDRLARWLAPVEGDLREGGEYRIVFVADDDGQRAWGTIEVCEAPRRLEVTWEFPGEPAGRVVATVGEAPGGAELTLTHTGLAHGSDVGYAAGWQVYLEHLGAVLDGVESPDFWSRWEGLRDAYATQVAI